MGFLEQSEASDKLQKVTRDL